MTETLYEQKYIDIVKKKILELAADYPAVIFLFGSRARGTHKQRSDIDVGFENLSKEEFDKLALRFEIFWEESIVPIKVDLVYFPEVNTDFANEAGKDIILWKNG